MTAKKILKKEKLNNIMINYRVIRLSCVLSDLLYPVSERWYIQVNTHL